MSTLSRPAIDLALDHYNRRQKLAKATSDVVGEMWDKVDPKRIVDSWATQLPEAVTVVSGAQLGAARPASRYTDDMLDEEGVEPAPAAEVVPSAFSGQASDARGLMGLLTNPVFVVLSSIQDGWDVINALFRGKQNLDMLVSTQVADAGRLADQVAITSRLGARGYIRMALGKSCARCLVLAGKFYRYNDGFRRHPDCDCIHVPATDPAARLARSPESTYARMTTAERTRAGFTEADQRAIREGADLTQVVNAKRGMYTAGGRKLTTEGTTKRGLYGGYKIDPKTGKRVARPRGEKAPPRLSVDEIFKLSGDNRDEALRLLADNGYVVELPKRFSQAERIEIQRRAEAFIDGEIGLADLAPWISSPNLPGGGTAAGVASTVAVRPVLARAKSMKGLEFEFGAEYFAITGKRLKAFELQGSLDTAKEHLEGLLRGLERFPDANLRAVYTIAATDGRYAEAAGNYVGFGDTWTGNRKRYLSSLQADEANGFHPRNVGNPVGVAVHEFGHTLDLGTLGHAIRAQVDELVARAAAETGLEAGRLIELTISKYAARNSHELVAEAFADVLINGSTASRLSREIFDLLEAEYRSGGRRVGVDVVSATVPRKAAKAAADELTMDEWIDRLVMGIPATAPRKTREAIRAELRRQADVAPQAVRELQGVRIATKDEWLDVRPDETDRAWAAYVTSGKYPGQILLHPRWGTAAERAKIEAVVRRAYETNDLGWSFPHFDVNRNLDVVSGIFRHEFGHHASKQFPLAVSGHAWGPVSRKTLLVPLAEELGVAPMAVGGDFVEWFNRSEVQRAIRAKVSAYAAQGPDELLAEIWSVFSGRGQEASKIARRIGEIMRQSWDTAPVTTVAQAAEDLSKLTVPKLRALAKERGITVPPGSKKPDIVRLLDETPAKPGVISTGELSVEKAQNIVDDLQAAVERQIEVGASAKATTAKVRTQLRAIRLQPIDAAGNDLVNTSAARAVRYEWRQPGRTVRLDRPPPADFTPIQLQEFEEAARLSRMALAVEDAQAAGADVVAAVRAGRAADAATSNTVSQTYVQRQAELTRRAGQRATGSETLEQGLIAETRVRVYADGGKAVSKVHHRPEAGLTPLELTDAEELTALVAGAVGARMPAVIRTGDHSILEEFVDGVTGSKSRAIGDVKYRRELAQSDDGQLIGLTDTLVLNEDRGPANWMIDRDGNLWGIDNGSAFAEADAADALIGPHGGEFNDQFVNAWDSRISASNDMSPGDMAVIRARLVKLRADFERLGRLDWYDGMIARADALTAAASGSRSRLATAGVVPDDAARKALRTEARARQADIDAATTRADALAELDELVGKNASMDVLTRNLDIFATTKALAPADITALRRVLATRDRVKIQATVDRISKKYKLTGVHSAGDVTKMREGFQTVGGPIPVGADVQVIRRGTEIIRNGEVITVTQPVVRVVNLAEKNQAALEALRGSADALAEAAKLVENGASLRALAFRARTLREAAGIPDPALEKLLKAMEAGDATKIRQAIAAAEKKLNLTPIGAQGELVRFETRRFEPIGRSIEEGALVRVDRVGYTGVLVGRDLLLRKAVVQEVDAAFLAQLRKTAIDEAKALLDNATRPLTALQLKKAGITKVGTVSKTKTVEFDPKVYDVKGGAKVPAGAKVRVVEPGYSLTYRGETVVLRKPVVEVVPSKPPAAYERRMGAAKKGDDALDSVPWSDARPGENGTGLRANADLFPDEAERRQILEAISHYRASGYVGINDLLRGKRSAAAGASPERLREEIAQLDRAMDASRLRHDVEVWRGLDSGQGIFGPRGDWPADLTGFTWEDPSYFSASARRRSAESYGRGVLLHILAPRGTQALGLSASTYESEILLRRGLRFRVVADRGLVSYGPPNLGLTHRVLDVEILNV